MPRRTRAQSLSQSGARQWWLIVYRVPSEPASRRVAVWRDLKRIGALYLQQCVCILPQIPGLSDELNQLLAKIPKLGGDVMRFDLSSVDQSDEARIIEAFRALRSSEYAEIIEECETKFVKEIEFEHFRQNYTFEEAEEIEQDLEKIRRWFERVLERDWFKADRRDEVETWLGRCQGLLAKFEEEVYRRNGSDAPEDEHIGESEREQDLPSMVMPITPLRPRARARRSTANENTVEVSSDG